MTHTCIANSACRGTTYETGERGPNTTEHPGTLCEPCTNTYRDAISRLARDYVMLRATLGEHRTTDKAPVHSTPTAGILIDSTSDRYITEIVEWTNYAADVISDLLHTSCPDGSRRPPAIRLDGAMAEPAVGSLAAWTTGRSRPPESRRLVAYLAMIEPHIETLAAAPKQTVQIWRRPERCDYHAEAVTTARRVLELARETGNQTEITEATDELQAAYSAAGVCDECCGWDRKYGQARQEAEMSGIDVLQRLTRTHQLIRKHLGQTKLRHRYAMPCPYCGAPIGRDDGDTVFTCENDECTSLGPSSWTEREYQLMAGMIGDEERAKATAKYLLAEAYYRLDNVAHLIGLLNDDKVNARAGSGTVIVEALKQRMAGHVDADERDKLATDKRTALLRQVDQDSWAWKREPGYERPKRKARNEPDLDPAKRIAASSLTLVTDTLEPEALSSTETVCGHCRLVQPCDC